MSIDRGAIETQLNSIGEGARWWEQREFRDLPYILNEDERIHGLVRGRVLGDRRPRVLPTGDWLIVATNQRLLCVRDERFGRKQIDVPLAHITGMQHSTRLFAAQVTLQTVDRKYRLRIAKDEAFRFIGALGPLVPRPQPAPSFIRSGLPAMLNAAGFQALSGVPALAALPNPEYASRADFNRLEGTVERLEAEIERLHQQVDFLENLLQQRVGREIVAGQRVGGSSLYPAEPAARTGQPGSSSSSQPSPRTVTPAPTRPAPTPSAAAASSDDADAPAADTRTEA